MTEVDVAELHKLNPGSKAQGTATEDMKWEFEVEVEVARKVPNFGEDQPLFLNYPRFRS